MQHKHRLVVMDTDTLKETFSWELTGLNIFTFAGITVIVLLILSSLLIAFTPMRNLVPGFIKPELKEEVARNAQTIDSLENSTSSTSPSSRTSSTARALNRPLSPPPRWLTRRKAPIATQRPTPCCARISSRNTRTPKRNNTATAELTAVLLRKT